ncbi:cytochrome c oxidase assembly protein [Microbacterium sp. JB110]|uniref:cytochrome c oxidase assembly protein n=1 Tax=Microbacterium sp. JB110 TaxID=2024477 RepID=UPI00097F19A4|nr:cytochrome c oxidase assembly protein [Microbacterium sp. JB110]RCS60001.1 copper transporter [Microbacterium sp. JB110]SJM44961.1 Copper resistance protein D [Frigoribacterium sp. JB110]
MNPRALRAVGPALLIVSALAVAAWALVVGGATEATELADAGPVVRWSLPLAKLGVNLSAAVMLGSLVLALFALRQGEREWDIALDTASIGAAVFTVASGAVTFLTFLDTFTPQVSAGQEFGAQFGRYLVELELGRAWMITTVLGAGLTVLAFAVRGWIPTLITAGVATVALIPMATQGHSGDLADHNIVVTALAIHVIGAAVWVGGLFLVVIVRPRLAADNRADRVRPVLERYSSLALIAFLLVAFSGILRSFASISRIDELFTTTYGFILLVKIIALLLMGALGAWYRAKLIATQRNGAFWIMVTLELALMGVASGAAAALARSVPPLNEQPPALETPAQFLNEAALPPELTPIRFLTEWEVDPLWLVVGVLGIAFYVAGVLRLRRRGDTWPIYRTVLWVIGMLLLIWVTSGALNAYGHYLFSAHMLLHMLLAMAIPLLLVPGAPVTLAARAIRRRDDGTRGGREWILWVVHNPAAKVLTHPLVAAGIFVGSLWLFYFTDLFRWALYDHLGHEWMVAHFLISGYLFVMSLTGIDPIPYRMPYAGRLVTLIVTMAMHAFFGIAIMSQSGLMVAEWFGAMGRTWGATPMEDQYVGGGIAWSIGEIPTVITAIVVAIQWSRSDEKQQRRSDRHADRTGDAELAAYNARLEAIAKRDAEREGR